MADMSVRLPIENYAKPFSPFDPLQLYRNGRTLVARTRATVLTPDLDSGMTAVVVHATVGSATASHNARGVGACARSDLTLFVTKRQILRDLGVQTVSRRFRSVISSRASIFQILHTK